MGWDIAESAIEETFLAGTGPGGQNVNKVASAVQLRVALRALGLPAHAERRLRRLAGSRLTGEDEIIITARGTRSREANREEARKRLQALVDSALQRPKRRIGTRPSRAARAKRIERKKQRGAIKKSRSKPQI